MKVVSTAHQVKTFAVIVKSIHAVPTHSVCAPSDKALLPCIHRLPPTTVEVPTADHPLSMSTTVLPVAFPVPANIGYCVLNTVPEIVVIVKPVTKVNTAVTLTFPVP